MAEMRRFIRFVIAGTTATGVNYGSFATMYWLGVNYLLAATLAYALSIGVGFALNRYFVFRSTPPSKNALVLYITVYVGSLLVNLILLELFVSLFSLDPLIANAIALVILVAVNFFVVRRFVFPKHPTEEPGT